ncbi:MAG: signal peptidase II [Clostridiales bacterium]|nr:signal peptidase II [Clostridiales bacterium]
MLYNPKHARIKPDGKLGYYLCALGVLTADQMSKDAVLSSMRLHQSIPLIPGFFHFTFIMNSGASFGMLQNQSLLFSAATILVVVVICWSVFFMKNVSRWARIVMGFITGGALGNFADRIQHGAVVDFLDFRGIWVYIFNIADAAVVCGGIVLALMILTETFIDDGRVPLH